MDISESIVPKSDQLNAEDLLSGPRTVTIAEVRKGSVEQPVEVHLAEFPGRPFKPSKTVRRILVAAWGPEASAYTGRRLTLYRDPAVRFGGSEVGGIRVSHMSHIDQPLTIALTVTRGKRAPYVVQPLPAEEKTRRTAPAALDDLRTILERAQKARTKAELRPLYKAAIELGADQQTAADLRAHAETLPDAAVAS